MKSIACILLLVAGCHAATLQEKSADATTIVPAGALLDEEVVTESVTSGSGIVSDSKAAADTDYIIRYPTTPYPDENTPTAPPPDLIPDEPAPPTRMTDQKVITGDADCSKYDL